RGRAGASPAELQGLRAGGPRRLPEDADRPEVHQGPEVFRPFQMTIRFSTQRSTSMRSRTWWTASAVAAALLLAQVAAAQPPGRGGRGRGDRGRGGPGGFRGFGRGLSADQVVERIMSFDKNKDGKITKDELPERMQFLIERGDANKDGALDK